MDWNSQIVERLAGTTEWTYHRGGPSFAEPAALTGLALLGAEQVSAAIPAAEWLASIQSPAGSVGISAAEATPCWPTALAISVWAQWNRLARSDRFAQNIENAITWTLRHEGKTSPPREGLGHDTSIRGWSWALGTHSWLEPTSMFVIALHQAGQPHHPRTLEATRMIVDRQLPSGGFNYGNTTVLGQQLLAHIQPTGLALAALGVAQISEHRVTRSIEYLLQEWPTLTSTASLCFAAIGLAAYDRSPTSLDQKLRQCYEARPADRHGVYKLALLSLAAQRDRCPITPRWRREGEAPAELQRRSSTGASP